jgi:hypothetical protein
MINGGGEKNENAGTKKDNCKHSENFFHGIPPDVKFNFIIFGVKF